MKKILFFTLSLICLNLFAQKKTKSPQPNILLIMADDLGFSDIGPYGSEIKTPNLDRLAKEGTRLRQCYNGGICATSRASLLTGQNPHKAGVGFFNRDLGLPAYQGYLNKESLTVAEVLKTGGYNTYMVGKWHVGNEPDKWPLKRGFDKFFGFIDGGLSFWDSKPIIKGGPFSSQLYDGDKEFTITDKNHYLTDALTDKAIGYLKEQPKDKPFFLYMAYNSPHWPLHAKPEDIEKYKGKYNLGWDSLRTIRHQNLVKLGIIDTKFKPFKDQNLPAWEKLTYDEKQFWVKKMEVYAAMVDNLDQNIGKLMSHLEETKLLDNTLIVFLSDNGAEDLDISKMSMAINRFNGTVGTAGSNESYTKNWAQLSNMPFKSYKSTPYEGGLSSPFIARLPKVIPANQTQQGAVHIIDMLPSFIEIANIEYPKTYNGITPNTLQGVSFISSLKNNQWNREKPIFHEWAGFRAVWDGKWKAVSNYPENKWELYDLSNDRTESNNVAKENPEILEKLNAAYINWAKANDVAEWNEQLAAKSGFKK